MEEWVGANTSTSNTVNFGATSYSTTTDNGIRILEMQVQVHSPSGKFVAEVQITPTCTRYQHNIISVKQVLRVHGNNE